LVEVKMNKELESVDVVAKPKAAVTWSNTVSNSGKIDGPWKYLLLSEDSFGRWAQMKVLHSG
jgi:type III restriction enzyme